jgi:hypothetical protein
MTLDFSKTILEKVSFDRYLFSKELRKLVIWMGHENEELKNLHKWCVDNFGEEYSDVIDQVFDKQRLMD